MAEAADTLKKNPKFAGITILSGLSKTNYFFFFSIPLFWAYF